MKRRRKRKKSRGKSFKFKFPKLNAKLKKKLFAAGQALQILAILGFAYLIFSKAPNPLRNMPHPQAKSRAAVSHSATVRPVPKPVKSFHFSPSYSPSPAPEPVRKKIWRWSVPVISSRKPKLVFVIDDIGNTLKYQDQLERLGNKVVYAVLPQLPNSSHFAQLSRWTGAEVILHLPLEAEDGRYPGPGLIHNSMSRAQVVDLLEANLRSVPGRIGVNNHMGSLGTSDPALMKIILSQLKQDGLFFLDSYTTTQTTGPQVGKQLGMNIPVRDVFLDNVDERGAILDQIDKLSRIARKKGYAIGIGHYRFNTLNVLNGEIPRLAGDGFEIISLSELMKREMRK